jgi:flagellar biosynthesis/type III secretory pathway protein FliH
VTTSADRLPCPICSEPRCILVRNRAGKLGQTCGKRTCAAQLRAQRLGPAHYQKLQAAAAAHRKPRLRSEQYIDGYGAGRRTGYRTGFKAGYEAALAGFAKRGRV